MTHGTISVGDSMDDVQQNCLELLHVDLLTRSMAMCFCRTS